MSISPDSPWRGAAAFLSQPVSREDEYAAQCLVETIFDFNCRQSITGRNLADIEYRSSDGEIDILRHVFRWDRAPYEFVFQNGFHARRQDRTTDAEYFNLELYVNNGGRPLDTRRVTTHAFVSTTMSSSWTPTVNRGVIYLYRYEIYAPGGILVPETLCELYRYPAQDEVSFPVGIAPQYIRSAQMFELTNDRGYTRRRRVNNILYFNSSFNPHAAPEAVRLRIQRPVSDYIDGNKQRQKLEIIYVQGRNKRSAATNSDDMLSYYAEGVTDVENYIDSAFRSTERNRAYIFFREEYAVMDYAPRSTDDRILDGPRFIGSNFYSLVGSAFAEYGIDAAFGCHDHDYKDEDGWHIMSEAMIFSGNLCARIDYAPWTTRSRILQGPKTIRQMFPFFEGTKFARGIDAAFESTRTNEAYLFKGSEYALIDYSEPSLIAIRQIADGFQCLRGTSFERDIGAAFASHRDQEAYLFKDNAYLRLYFTPGECEDYIMNGPKPVVPQNWPSLNGILPRKNRGLDVYEFPVSNSARDEDEDD